MTDFDKTCTIFWGIVIIITIIILATPKNNIVTTGCCRINDGCADGTSVTEEFCVGMDGTWVPNTICSLNTGNCE